MSGQSREDFVQALQLLHERVGFLERENGLALDLSGETAASKKPGIWKQIKLLEAGVKNIESAIQIQNKNIGDQDHFLADVHKEVGKTREEMRGMFGHMVTSNADLIKSINDGRGASPHIEEKLKRMDEKIEERCNSNLSECKQYMLDKDGNIEEHWFEIEKSLKPLKTDIKRTQDQAKIYFAEQEKNLITLEKTRTNELRFLQVAKHKHDEDIQKHDEDIQYLKQKIEKVEENMFFILHKLRKLEEIPQEK